MKKLYKPIIYLLIIVELKGILQHILAEEVCEMHSYLTDLNFTCCEKKRYTPGINLMAIDKCIPSTEDKKTAVISVMWNIYDCLVKSALKGKDLTLPNFATMMYENQRFPTDIINGIIERVSDFNTNTSMNNIHSPPEKLIMDYKNLIAIKTAYFEIEKKVCEGTPKTNKTYKTYDAFTRCLPWVESNYNLGDCCNGYPIPMPIYPDPYIPTKDVSKFTEENIIPIVGKYKGDANHTSVLMLCYRTARHLILNNRKLTLINLKENVQLFKDPDYDEIADAIIPKYYNKSLKSEIKAYLTNDLTVNNTEFIHLQREEEYYLPKYEFESHVNSNITKFLFWHCAAYQVMSRKMKEFELREWCGN